MSFKLITKKLEISNKKFITIDELKKYCRELKMDYYTLLSYLLNNGYMVRILRGIFYVKSIEERKLKKVDINYLNAIKKALEIKGVKKWYLGMDSALKMSYITHEFLAVDYIINDKIFRPKPFEILGHKIKFIKINTNLFGFGIKKTSAGIFYSNVEKTILDIVYLGRYNHMSDEEINNKIADLVKNCSKSKLKKYFKNYPKTIPKFLEGMMMKV